MNGRQPVARGWNVLLSVWLALTILGAALAAVYWYLAPLALGFAGVQPDPDRPQWLFWLSWNLGLPLLVLAQIAALMLAFRHLRAAALLSTAALAVFLLLIGCVMATW